MGIRLYNLAPAQQKFSVQNEMLVLSNISFWTKNLCSAGAKLYDLMPIHLDIF